MSEHGVYAPEIDTCLASGIAALPPAVQQTVLLNVSEGFCSIEVLSALCPLLLGEGSGTGPRR